MINIALKGQDYLVSQKNSVPAADAILELFESHGVEDIFCSPGSEWPPMWEALSNRRNSGQEMPRYYNCRHEILAVSAAGAYHHVSGKIPVVLVHTTVGFLSGSMAIRAAYKEHVPMLIFSGASSTFGESGLDVGPQWLRVLADNAGPSRLAEPIVKWTGSVFNLETLEGTIEHAFQIAQTPPQGPAFVYIPFEIMLGNVSTASKPRKGPSSSVSRSVPRHEDLERAKELLIQSSSPLIITEYAGRRPSAVDKMVQLAECLSIPVIEAQSPEFMNFPRDHFLHQGFDPKTHLEHSDLILLVGVTTPWYPPSMSLSKENAKVILIDSDPDKARMPYWNYKIDLTLSGAIEDTLDELLRLVKAEKNLASSPSTPTSGALKKEEERMAALTKNHDLNRKKWEEEARRTSAQKPLDPRWLCYVLNKVLPKNAVLVDETTSHRRLVNMLVTRTEPGSFLSGFYGGLGTGLGTGLGIKTALKDHLVVVLIGDGAFNYNPVTACFGFAQEYNLPILVVLFNNEGYTSQQAGVLRHYPEGAAVKSGLRLGTKIRPAPDYAQLPKAFGGYGERVEEPGELEASILRALDKVKNGQFALVDVLLEESDPRRKK
jgi:acetolactate synthase-1/2/3 large subunit